MEKHFGQLTENIITKEDLVSLIEDINTVQNLIFKNIDKPLSEKSENRISNNLQAGIEQLEKEGVIAKDAEKNRHFFDKFKQYLQTLPQFKITIAFKAKKDFVDKLSALLQKEAKQKVILDLTYKPEIIGGAIIEYQNKRINLSLARKAKEIISQKQL